MNNQFTHDPDEDLTESDHKQVTRSNRIIGWCVMLVASLLMLAPFITWLLNRLLP